MKQNKDDCEIQKINVLDFVEKLLKSGELIRKEKIWNIFKNIDISYRDLISITEIRDFCKKKNMDFNYEILKKHVKDENEINFVEFDAYCEEANLISLN